MCLECTQVLYIDDTTTELLRSKDWLNAPLPPGVLPSACLLSYYSGLKSLKSQPHTVVSVHSLCLWYECRWSLPESVRGHLKWWISLALTTKVLLTIGITQMHYGVENHFGDKSLGNAQLLSDNEEGGVGVGLTSASKSSQSHHSPPHSDNPGCYRKDYRCIIEVCSFALYCLLSELNGIHVIFTHTYLQIFNKCILCANHGLKGSEHTNEQKNYYLFHST